MIRIIASFLILSFIFWILPLGFFIKPSQQKLACDGQRAICMCHAFVPKMNDKAMEAGLVIKSAPGPNNENPSSGGSYFISAKPVLALNLKFPSFFENQYFCYKNPFLAPLDNVPKF
jgi:hypothetical protein